MVGRVIQAEGTVCREAWRKRAQCCLLKAMEVQHSHAIAFKVEFGRAPGSYRVMGVDLCFREILMRILVESRPPGQRQEGLRAGHQAEGMKSWIVS